MSETVLITGGAGYIGAHASRELSASGKQVRVLDRLLHGQRHVAAALERDGIEVVEGDVRGGTVRATALAGGTRSCILRPSSAIRPAREDPEFSNHVNVLCQHNACRPGGVRRRARWCSPRRAPTTAAWLDPTVPIAEDGELRPVSLYASQKVQIEQAAARPRQSEALHPTCLRFATVYGVAPRMRFDLTVNEFTRDLWAGRALEVFGEQFWRPDVHVRDAPRRSPPCSSLRSDRVDGRVFNVGRSDRELPQARSRRAHPRHSRAAAKRAYVSRSDDPRDYKVSFERIRLGLGFEPTQRCPTASPSSSATSSRLFGDPYDPGFRN